MKHDKIRLTREAFKQARLKAGLHQETLGRFLRVSSRQIKRYENGFSAIPGPVGVLMGRVIEGRWPKLPKRDLKTPLKDKV